VISSPGHIHCIYSSAYSDFNDHMNVSALLLGISRQFNARSTANIETNTAYIIQFTKCVLWSRKIYNAITAPHIHTSIFILTYLRWYCRYLENSTRDIRQTWSQMRRSSSSSRYMNCGPGHVQWNYSSTYSGVDIRLNVSRPLLEICREFNAPYTANFVPSTAHILQITLSEWWSLPYTE
jgi:hypothetical protein